MAAGFLDVSPCRCVTFCVQPSREESASGCARLQQALSALVQQSARTNGEFTDLAMQQRWTTFRPVSSWMELGGHAGEAMRLTSGVEVLWGGAITERMQSPYATRAALDTLSELEQPGGSFEFFGS